MDTKLERAGQENRESKGLGYPKILKSRFRNTARETKIKPELALQRPAEDYRS